MKAVRLILILFFVSCGSNKKVVPVIDYGSTDSVFFSKNESDEPAIVIDDTISSQGPSPIDNRPALIENRSYPVIAIHFGHGIYRTAGYIGVLRALEKNNIKISMVLGTGFGSIIGAIYALEGSTSKTEWQVFKLMSALKPQGPVYSRPWLKEIDNFLQQEFENKYLQNLKIQTYIPLYNKKTKKVKYFSRGVVRNTIMNAVSFYNKQDGYIAPNSITSLNIEEARERGADISIYLSAMGTKVVLNNNSGYLLGVYNTILSNTLKQKDENFFSVNQRNQPLDELIDLENYLKRSEELGDQIVKKLQSQIDQWFDRK